MSNTNYVPFSTIEPCEAMMRAGLLSLCLEQLREANPVSDQRSLWATIDSPSNINQRLAKTFDINFPPLAVINVYKQLRRAVKEGETVLASNDLYMDTVVMDVVSGGMFEPIFSELFGHGVFGRQITYLAVKQAGKTHLCICGDQDLYGSDVERLFKEYGQVKGIYFDEMLEQYNEVKYPVDSGDEAVDRENATSNWLIANALIVNLAFTAANMQKDTTAV